LFNSFRVELNLASPDDFCQGEFNADLRKLRLVTGEDEHKSISAEPFQRIWGEQYAIQC
jgi:hypothetical protein